MVWLGFCLADRRTLVGEPFGDAQVSWPVWQIALVLYPFGAGAMAVNVFFASLIGSWVGGPILSTAWSIGLGCLIGVPTTVLFARHMRRLMDEAGAQDTT